MDGVGRRTFEEEALKLLRYWTVVSHGDRLCRKVRGKVRGSARTAELVAANDIAQRNRRFARSPPVVSLRAPT